MEKCDQIVHVKIVRYMLKIFAIKKYCTKTGDRCTEDVQRHRLTEHI